MSTTSVRGRGAAHNPRNRFTRLHIVADPEAGPEPDRVATSYLSDGTRSIITYNQSPDVPFEASINPYRGCEHGCSYCYARPFHEYLGLSAGLDFETQILVKETAADLLRDELASPRWKPQVVALSGVTDAYQPIERRLEITRACLEVLSEAHNPVVIVTKNHLVTRDADLLGRLADDEAAGVMVSITTLDGELAGRLEPRASHPRRRLAAIAELHAAGIPAGVLMAPIIPGLNDHEIPAVLAAAAEAGAACAGFVVLRLPGGVAELFTDWLERWYPERKDKILHRVEALRGGRLNTSEFGERMRGEGIFADQIRDLFHLARRRAGLARHLPELSTAGFRRPAKAAARDQLTLFDG